MGAFNVAVAAEDVAAAMEPYRYREWNWYAVGGYDWPEIAAYVDAEGRWAEGPPPPNVPVTIVRCKG